MRGWPLGKAVLTLIALLILAWPLKQLTTPKQARNEKVAPAEANTEKVAIRVVFSAPPHRFSVKFLGNEVLSGPNGSTSLEYNNQTALHFPPEGIDLIASAAFSDESTPHKMDVELVRADGSKYSQSLSGTKEIEDVLFFSGTAVRQ